MIVFKLHKKASLCLWCRSRFRVEVKPFNLSTSLFNLQYSESRPVCYPSEQPNSKFCVLVPRSRSNGNKCIHSSLVRSSELCLSPIQSDYEVSEKDPNRQSQSPFCGSSVEIDTIVSGPSFNAVRSPTIASECFGSVDTTILPERLLQKQVTLAMWPLSGDFSQSLVFLQGCPKLSCHPGDQVLKLNMEVLGQNGAAAMSSGRKILFLVILIVFQNFWLNFLMLGYNTELLMFIGVLYLFHTYQLMD